MDGIFELITTVLSDVFKSEAEEIQQDLEDVEFDIKNIPKND